MENVSFSKISLVFSFSFFLNVRAGDVSDLFNLIFVLFFAGGLDIVYGIPFEIVSSGFGVIILAYALICIVGGVKLQARTTFALAIFMGLAMLLVVIGGSVYVIHDVMGGNYTLANQGIDVVKPTIIPKACKCKLIILDVGWCW